jgi:hypothetical protein
MGLLFSMVSQAIIFAEEERAFLDLKRDDPSAGPVYELLDYGIIEAQDTYFKPDEPITRAELQAIVNRLYNDETVSDVLYNGLNEQIGVKEFAKAVIDYLGYKEEVTLYIEDDGYYMLNCALGIAESQDYIYDETLTRLMAIQIVDRLLDIEFDNSNGYVNDEPRKRFDGHVSEEYTNYNPERIIEFKDAVFEDLVRKKHDLTGPIKWKDLYEIEGLVLEGTATNPIINLNDLVWFANLKEFQMTYPDSFEGKPLESFSVSMPILTHLKQLEVFIYDHPKANFSLQKFWSLPHLKTLNFYNSKVIGDLSVLKNTLGLEVLGMNGEISGNVWQLGRYKNLKVLSVSSWILRGDIGFIKDLKDLEYIRLIVSGLSGNIDNFASLNKVNSIWISGDNDFFHNIQGDIKDISHLDLELFFIQNTEITGDISNLNNMSNLNTLILIDSEIEGDLSTLPVKKLEGVYIDESKITGSIERFKLAEGLEYIYVTNSLIGGDLSALSNCTSLERCDVTNSDVTGKLVLANGDVVVGFGISDDIIDAASNYNPNQVIGFVDDNFEYLIRSFLGKEIDNILWKDIINIESIDLASKKISSINDLIWFKNLKTFRIGYLSTSVESDLSVIKDLSKLEVLDLRNSSIEGDLSVLENHKNLKVLNLRGTEITGDLSVINKLKNLEELDLFGSYKMTVDLKDVGNFKSLKSFLSNRNVTGDLSDLNNLNKLNTLLISGSAVTGDLSDLRLFTDLQFLEIDCKKVTGNLKDLVTLINLEKMKIQTKNVSEGIK